MGPTKGVNTKKKQAIFPSIYIVVLTCALRCLPQCKGNQLNWIPWAEKTSKMCQIIGVNGIIAKTAELDHRHHFPFVSPLKIFIGEQNCFQIILYIILDTCED